MKEEALYDRWWHAPAESEQQMEDSHAPFWEKVLDRIVEKEGMRDFSVLDFGCNQGGFLRFLYARHSFKEGVGTDLGIESIRVANERKGDLPLTYVATASPEQWGQRFDLAVSTAVIYLISDLREHAQKSKQRSNLEAYITQATAITATTRACPKCARKSTAAASFR